MENKFKLSPLEKIGDFKNIMSILEELIFNSVMKDDNPKYSIFHGCFDWHSCVHGHWALFRIARINNSPLFDNHIQIILKKYTPENITKELEYLFNNPNFEIPYGYAWFLRFYMDYAQYITSKGEKELPLRIIADKISNDLFNYLLIKGISPTEGEYNNPCWALAQLYSYYIYINEPDKASSISVILDSSCKYPLSFDLDETSEQFFSLFGNWIYAISIIHPQSLSLALQNHPCLSIEPFDLKDSVHHLGILWSRAWTLKALSNPTNQLSETDRLKYSKCYLDHITKAISVHNTIQAHQKYQDYSSYYAYDHWVPQFIIYALTDGL